MYVVHGRSRAAVPGDAAAAGAGPLASLLTTAAGLAGAGAGAAAAAEAGVRSGGVSGVTIGDSRLLSGGVTVWAMAQRPDAPSASGGAATGAIGASGGGAAEFDRASGGGADVSAIMSSNLRSDAARAPRPPRRQARAATPRGGRPWPARAAAAEHLWRRPSRGGRRRGSPEAPSPPPAGRPRRPRRGPPAPSTPEPPGPGGGGGGRRRRRPPPRRARRRAPGWGRRRRTSPPGRTTCCRRAPAGRSAT